jgi:hypothetical protein
MPNDGFVFKIGIEIAKRMRAKSIHRFTLCPREPRRRGGKLRGWEGKGIFNMTILCSFFLSQDFYFYCPRHGFHR